jgi:ABC-type glycerol-3-phosphate transport system substrate-binding protein
MHSYVALADYMKAALPRYQEANKNVKFDLQVMPSEQWNQKVSVEIAAGRGPDIANAHTNVVRPMIAGGAAQAVPEGTFTSSQIKDQWIPASLAAASWKGKYYFLPREQQGWSWKVNRAPMEAAGITELPKDYQKHLELLTKTTKRNDAGKIIHSGTGMMPWTYNWFGTVYLSMGGGKMFETKPDKQVVAFNNDIGRAALKSITDLVTQHKVWEPEFPVAHTAFSDGKMTAAYIGGWLSSSVLTKNPDWKIDAYSFRVGVPSTGKDGAKVFSVPGWGWIVLSGSSQSGPAWDLWKWLYQKEELAKASMATGEPCPVKGVTEIIVNSGHIAKRPDLKYDFEDVKDAGYEYAWNTAKVEKEFNDARDRIILQGMSVNESMNLLETAANLVIADAFRSEQ